MKVCSFLPAFVCFAALTNAVVVVSAPNLWAQGETTSAILGQVTDSSNAVVPGATVTTTNRDTGLRRSVKTDQAGRFDFPQLLPGAYTVRAEASGFEPQQAQDVFAGLGQKQTVNLT
ncbi:MAG: carboxypeptidase-like regulatory domain-containing protein, partial [Candidatus Korobacteraceae bacterium]